MSLLDFSKNCNISDRSFVDDLLPYSLENNEIIWSDNTKTSFNVAKDIFASSQINDYWTPYFITDDSLIKNKTISHYGSILGDSSYRSGRIGIENFITFLPQFKNWNVNNGLMTIDWILNRSRTAYAVEAGLMYWQRKKTAVKGKITSFPPYTKLKHNGIVYIKLDNETVRQISPKKVYQASFRKDASLSFNYNNDDLDTKIADLNNPDFVLDGSDDIEIWIPDGDQLLYFANQLEARQNNIQGIASRSYISGSLYKYYNIFYNSLTAGEKLVKVTETRSTHRLRQYKKLAHSLSTSPFSSEFFAALLAKPSSLIETAIDAYLTTDVSDIQQDLRGLTFVMNTISQEYSKYEINNTTNIVKNNTQLFSKLVSKYGAKLELSQDAVVNYKPALVYGDSVLLEEIGDLFVKKDLSDATVVANKIIRLTNLSIETSIGPTISSILLKHKNETTDNIVLYDSVKPDVNPGSNLNILLEKNNNVDDFFRTDLDNIFTPIIPVFEDYDQNVNVFYWGPKDIQNNMSSWLQNCPKLKILNLNLLTKYTNPRFPNQAQELLDSEFVCVWEKISGPSCKFVDLSKTQTNKTYNRAYSNEVMLVPSSTGKYVIKCVVSCPYGSYTKIKTLFIVDGREQIAAEPEQRGPNNQIVMLANPNFATYSQNGIDNLFGSLSVSNDTRININNIDMNQYRTENAPIGINTDNLKVFAAGLDSMAIHRNGLLSTIRTNYLAERVTAHSRPIEKLNENNNYLFNFNKSSTINIEPRTEASSFSINYICNNTIIKLDRIILRNIRNETKECSQCYSLYRPKLKSFISGLDRRPQFSRSNKYPDGFTLQKYLPDVGGTFFPSETQTYSYPIISNDIAPPLYTYGGYGHQVLDQLSINNIDSLKKPQRIEDNESLIAKSPAVLPAVTGYNLNYKDDFNSLDDSIRNYKFCYQQNVMPSGHIEFSKGTFVPNSGWVIADNRNLSSVLKFNPGARKSFSFAGPGILGIGNYTNNDQITANILTSSIELNINPAIQWDNGGLFCPLPTPPDSNQIVNQNRIASIRGTHNMRNQLNKELADQYFGGSNDYHHGYRILNGGSPKRTELNLLTNSVPQNDEFNISIDEDTNRFTYSFNVVGPNEKIGLDDESQAFIDLYQASGIDPGSSNDSLKVRDFIEKRSGIGIRNPRVNNLTIKDVEVQLNFLNYVNTKNLAIWLEVEFCSSEKQNMKLLVPETFAATPPPPRALPQIKAQNNFIDQFISNDTHKKYTQPDRVVNQFFISDNIDVENDKVNQYLKNLTDHNSRDSVGDKVILYLLNQETIQNKDYNFSIKFSDSANKHNVLYDHNSYSQACIDPDQNIVSNQNSVNPSKHVDQADTYENSTNTNLNKLNRLNINNNTFHKLSNRLLFIGEPANPPREGCSYLFPFYDSSTKFTLKIAVLEEEDDMFPMDTIVNNDLFTDIASVDTLLSSANLFNNLCSWELILHTEDVKKPVTSQVNSLANYGGTDSLSLIEYGSEPKYPGYGFIANLKDQKFLLPLVNMNAPTTFFQNYNACEYADNELIGKGTLINQPRFPTEALIFILAGTAVGGMTGSLVGVLVGGLGPTYALGFELLFDYFKESRQVPLLELAQRETFDIEYDGYPFGNADKILVNASKDGVFWYKMEASIFKLSNTPALPLKPYTLMKADNKLFRFDFNIVSQNSDIIDELFIPYIIDKATPVDADEETVARYQDINSDAYHDFNFMSVDELVFANKVIHSENIFRYLNKPNQTLVIIDHIMPYYLISIGDTISLDCDNLKSIVMSKALIYKDQRYRTVLTLNKSNAELSGCSSLLLPENVVVICGTENSTVEKDIMSPVSLFGLTSEQPPNDTIPDSTFSTNSLGSYGDGSPVKDKNILSRKVQINHVESVYDQLNSFNNDKYYYNELSVVLPSGNNQIVMAPNTVPTGVHISIKSQLEAYPIYYDISKDNVLNNSFYHIYDNTFNNNNTTDNIESIKNLLDNIDTSIKDNKSYSKDVKYNMMYLKTSSDTISQLYRNAIVPLTIENNYSYKDTIERITQDQLTVLLNRLSVLNKDSDSALDILVGNATRTSQLLLSDSIFYIQQHYESLPEDSPDCSRITAPVTCYKHNTYSKLHKLYAERSEIIDLINRQTLKKAKIFVSSQDFDDNKFFEDIIQYENITSIKLINNVTIFDKGSVFKIEYSYILNPETQKYHLGDGGIIPDQKVNIVEQKDGALAISYETASDSYYWINIDPKQSCGIAEEMRPRILKSVKYICQNTNPVFSTGGVRLDDFNNICPDWITVNNLENDILKISADSTGTVYSFKEDFIEQQKNEWNNKVWGWKTQQIERRFRINSEQNIKNLGNNVEFLVTAIETYEVALDQIEAGYQNGRNAGLSTAETTELLIEENIIKTDFSGDIYGLLNNSSGSALGLPTRVYNIFNLDDVNKLKIQFRKAPRAIRGIDAIGTILRYGTNMSYRPQNRPPLDPLDAFGVGRTESLINNFYEWRCLQKDPLATQDSGGTLVDAQTPTLFQLFNEMMFRTFFGSTDAIENKNSQLRSLYDFEMIPYEYFTNPPPK